MIALWAASAVLGGWSLAAAARIAWHRARAPSLPPAGESPPTLVLVPMRDEEANVEGVLEGLLAQSARPRIRVIDDDSSDRTGERVAEIARREPRLECRAAGPLPAGWRGKVHALARGAEDAREPWLLLTDADTRHAPDLLARAHAAAGVAGLQAVSLAGRQEAHGFEALVTPIVFALLDFMLGDWTRAARGEGPAIANGQFILVERAALERAGGFAAVRRAQLDDVALARALRASGARTGFWRAAGLQVRMYQGLHATLRGWRRNLATILGERPAAAAAAVAALALPGAVALAELAAGAPLPAFLLWLAGAAAEGVVRASSRHPLWPAWLHPLSPWLTALIVGAALFDWRRGRLQSWKGRPISREARR
jgi:cellulose synthase/poly-beta-1,6-N-acetylglucosamine synthase-like glycosyltransferase